MKKIFSCVLGLFLATAALVAQSSSVVGTLVNTNDTVQVPSQGTVGVTITGAFSMTINFEGTTDGVNWFAIMTQNCTTGSAVTSTTTTGLFQMPANGMRQARVRANPVTSGTATINMYSLLYASKQATATYAAAPPGVVYMGGDPTGVTDSAAALGAALDTVISNCSLYNTINLRPGGTYKIGSSVVRTAIPTNCAATGNQMRIIIQGNGATLDASAASFGGAILDLEGSQGAGDPLNPANSIAKSDTTVTLNSNAQGIAAGDYILITTAAYGATQFSTNATVTSGVNCSVTGVNGGNWNVGDNILVSNQTSPPIPFGTTISAVGTGCPSACSNATLTLNTNTLSCSGISGVNVYHPSTSYLFSPSLFQSYRGEIQQVQSIASLTLTLKTHTFDAYPAQIGGVNSTTVYKLQMPQIRISSLYFKRGKQAGVQSLIMQYCADCEMDTLSSSGNQNRGLYGTYWMNGDIHESHVWDSYCGSCYGIVVASPMQGTQIWGNRIEEAWAGIDTGGIEPIRDCIIRNNVVRMQENAGSAFACIGMHENSEYDLIDHNVCENGPINIQAGGGAGVWARGNIVNMNLGSSVSGININQYGNVDTIGVEGNKIYMTTNTAAQAAILFRPSFFNATLGMLEIKDNYIRTGGTASGVILITPFGDPNTGNTINVFKLTNNDVLDGSTLPSVRVFFSSSDTGPAGVKINEAYVTGGSYENNAASGPAQDFVYDPDVGSGPILFSGVRIKNVRNPGGNNPINIGNTSGTHHNITDVTICCNSRFIASTLGGSVGNNVFFNTGNVIIQDSELANMANHSGFFPGNGGTDCGGGACTPGTNSPLNYYLKNVRKTNVSGVLTFAAGTGYVDDRGAGQTQLGTGDYALNANWGTGPTKAVNVASYDSRGSLSITAGTTPAAGPVTTVTFKQPYLDHGPVVTACNIVDTTAAATAVGVGCTTTTTTLVATGNFTPVAGHVYFLTWRLE